MARRALPDPATCPQEELHTPRPEGYMQRQAWAERMSKTHKQKRCPGCARFAIWIPKVTQPAEPVVAPAPGTKASRWTRPPEPCTTATRERQHLSADLAQALGANGRRGTTLCGNEGHDESYANRPMAWPRPTVVLADLPLCRSCERYERSAARVGVS